MKEYLLSPSSSRAEILDVFQKLEVDAREAARDAAYRHFVGGDAESARLAAEYEGQRRILASLRWAFSGEGEEDGCESKVGITS